MHTVYVGWTERHEVVQRFWRVMNGLSNKDRSLFLRFTWSRSRLPKNDDWSRLSSFAIKMRLMKCSLWRILAFFSSTYRSTPLTLL